MIRVHNLTKSFKLYHSPADRLKEVLFGKRYHKEFTALQDVSFEVAAGETLGIIGQNGAGKSTLLKLLMGILIPDAGSVAINGKITGLLELTTGFNPDFTGVQNVYLNATLRGMSKKEIDTRLEQIVAFSELDDFIGEPIKTYSSGMVMRLAFSIAIHADPQAFVVDEALAVGDAYFSQKCKKKMMEFKESGGSLVFVSHDLNTVKILCDRVLLLDHGRVVESGDADRVINTYNFLLAKKSEGQEIKLRTTNKRGKSYGNFKVEIVHIKMLNAQGHDGEVFVSGQPCTIHIMLKAQEPVDEITVGILIQDKFGQDIFGTNTYHLKTPIMLTAGRDCLVQYTIDELNIGPGQYSLTVAAHTADCHIHECYHWVDMIRTFQIVSPQKDCFIGIARLSPSVRVYSELQRTVIDKPLAPDVYKAELSCIESPMCCIDRNTIVSLPVKIKNASRGPWPALGGPDGRHWIKLAYHILDAHEHIIIFDGIRTTLPGDLAPQQEVIVQARVQAPDRPGAYIIEFDVVQEMVSWFATRGSKTMRIAIQVR